MLLSTKIMLDKFERGAARFLAASDGLRWQDEPDRDPSDVGTVAMIDIRSPATEPTETVDLRAPVSAPRPAPTDR